MANLKGLLKKASREYQTRMSAAERQVVRWVYWSCLAYDPRAQYFDRYLRCLPVKRGTPVPNATARTCAFGFDAKCPAVVGRPPKTNCEPAFSSLLSYTKQGIESA